MSDPRKFKNDIVVEGDISLPSETAERALVVGADGKIASSAVTSTELGYLAGVTSSVQDQIDDALAAGTGAQTAIDNHINDTADAHDASAISNVPAGNLAATDVQGALNELQGDIDGLDSRLDAVEPDVADLITLTGVAANSTTLGTFTGTLIPDNSDIKEALQALESEIEAIPNPFYYAGTWAASTNTPTLANADTGVQGAVYYVTDAGSVDFGAGSISFAAGDKVANNGTTWDKWDMTDNVASVFGRVGAVTAQSGDYTASQITNVPAGTIAATDVQAAINELDGDIALKANQSLNNLTATSINQSLLPDASGSRSLGSVTRSFTTVFATRYAAAGATVALASVVGSSGSTSVTVASTAGIIGGSVYSIFVPSLGVKVLIATVVDATTLTLASTLPQTITGETAFAIPNFIGRTENETGSNPSGDGIVRSGNTVSGKSGDVSILSGSATSGGTTGDVRVASGTTAGTRGRVILDGREISASSREIKSLAAGTTSDAAVNKGQLDAVVATIPARSAGDINETSFSLANNQASAANVTGLAFAAATVRSFSALVSVEIDATSDLYEQFTLQGINKGSSFNMSVDSVGDSSGVTFSITSAGQVQYTSGNAPGFVSGLIKFRAITTTV